MIEENCQTCIYNIDDSKHPWLIECIKERSFDCTIRGEYHHYKAVWTEFLTEEEMRV